MHANHPKFKQAFNNLTKKYKVVPLGTLCESIFSGITPKAGGDAYTQDETGVLFVKSGCLSFDGTITFDETSKIIPEIHNGIMKASQLKRDDILIAIVGATIGKVGIYDSDREANINQAIAAVRLKRTSEISPDFLIAYLLSDMGQMYLEYLKRPVARANINLQEIASIGIPILTINEQIRFVKQFNSSRSNYKSKLRQADGIISICKDNVFASLKLQFDEYRPSFYSVSKLGDVRELGIYCNPHSDYLNDVFSKLRANNFFAGHLEDFVEINPKTSRENLQDKTTVSFVPMTAVTEKTNEVVYELKTYSDVRTGFTIFHKGDLLWAKITPCMQNGKSFVASDMPTDIGFGSTEFHVLRAKNPKKVYMPFLWIIFSNDHILEAAQGMFGGSAGQQRVPDTFLKKFPIVLPSYEAQVELADQVFEALEKAKKMQAKAEYDWQTARKQFEKELLGV